MAKTIEQLKAQGAEVKNATVVGENTATRVGTLFNDIVEHVEDYEAKQAERDTQQDNTAASLVSAEAEARDIAINNEAQTRATNDENLNKAIVAEIDRAKAAEEVNAAAIAAEAEKLSELESKTYKQWIYDVSANNGGAVFESLSALLNNANLSTLIPASVRCGGMSIRFIQGSVPNSDNKYVQFRCISDEFSTTPSDWQGVDDEPTAGSENLVKSDGIYKSNQQSLNIKGIFSRESDFTNYNGVRVYDISASKRVPDTYKVGLSYIGILHDTVEILLTKDGEDIKVASNYLAEFYTPISSLDEDEIQTFTIPALNSSLYGGIEYKITVNVNDLKTTAGIECNHIFFDKEYLNHQHDFQRNDLKSVNLSSPLDIEKWACVKKFNIYIPSTDNHNYYLKHFGMWGDKSGQYFIIILGIIGSDDILHAQTVSSPVLPTKGVSKIPFVKYYITNTPVYDYVFDVEIDWRLYSGVIINENSNRTDISISPLVSLSGDLTDGGILTGNIILSQDITISNGVHLYGNNCSVNFNNHTITLTENSGIHNIKFYNNWDINRTVNLNKESGLDPSLTLDDVKDVLSDTSLLGSPSIIINGTSSKNTQIDGCTFYQIDGIAVRASSMAHRSNQQPLITNCYFNECKCGLHVNGEFIKVNNCTFDNNYYGIYILAGNSNVCNCFFKRCDCAVLMKGGGNGMHGQMCNTEIAHCMVVGLFVHDDAVNLGYVFNGCQWADASIEADECHSLMFNGCRMETWFKIDSGSKNSIHNSIFGKAYANSYQKTFLDFPSDTSLMGNRGINGCTDGEVNNNVLNP